MPVTDYSKFDKMEFEEVEDDERPRKPRVTRLEGPSRITLGAPPEAAVASGPVPHTSGQQKRTDALDYSKWDRMVIDEDDEDGSEGEGEEELMRDATSSAPAAAGSSDASFRYEYPSRSGMSEQDADAFEEDRLDPSEEVRLREILATPSVSAPPPSAIPPEDRFAALTARLSRNGAVRESYLWRQTEDEVEISILLPPGTRAKQVRPQLLPATEPSGAQTLLLERTAGSAPFFRGVLAYPVEQTEEEDELVWEITDYEPDDLGGRRVLRTTLKKRAMLGVVVWWARAMQGEAEVDTRALPDRKRAPEAQGMQTTWEQAQAMFKERVANRKPQEVWLSGEGPSDEPSGVTELDEGGEEAEEGGAGRLV